MEHIKIFEEKEKIDLATLGLIRRNSAKIRLNPELLKL